MSDQHFTAQHDHDMGDPFAAIAAAADESLSTERLAAIFDDFDAEAFGAEHDALL